MTYLRYTYYKASFKENHRYNNYSEEEQLAVVGKYPLEISYIKNPSEKVQLEVIKYGWSYIRYIDNPSKEIQLEAIKEFPEILNNIKDYINNPCQEVLDMLMIKDIIE